MDFALLVADPTPFSLHDLKLTVEAVQRLGLPCGVVINRANLPSGDLRSFCKDQSLPILGEIPDDRRLAEAYSRGRLVCEALPEYETLFERLLEAVTKQATAQLDTIPREIGYAGSRYH
jgi:MinD superfamily P-loop ATPase